VPALLEESRTCKGRIEVLLVLLGEKEEEVEAMMGDIQDIKGMYKDQMEELLEQVIVERERADRSTGLGSGSGPEKSPRESQLEG
jgi:TATA element modulatory factor 1 TATA binding